jgi:hypothetical protein
MEATNSALVLPSESTEPSLSDIHDIRSLVEVPSTWGWLWGLLIGIVVAGLLYWAFLYWKKRRDSKAEEPSQPSEPAHERARRHLEAALEYLHDPDRFCVLVSNAIRSYLEERFDLRAPERTTEEFLDELQGSNHLNEEQKQSLANFLTECDMVKFAKSEPEAFELKRLYESALQLVRETEPNLLEQTSPTEPLRES